MAAFLRVLSEWRHNGRQQGMRTTFNSYHRYACSLFLTAALAHRASSTLAGPLLATRMSVCVCCASSFFWFGRLWAPSRRTTHSVALHLSAIIQEHYHRASRGYTGGGKYRGFFAPPSSCRACLHFQPRPDGRRLGRGRRICPCQKGTIHGEGARPWF